MHFPEAELTTYLRVFLPEARIEGVLDEIAEAALDSGVVDEVEFFSLAHWLMDSDERRTVELEAVALVEEVGLDVTEVAIVLDLDRSEVEAAVARAWREISGEDAVAEEPVAEPVVEEPTVEPEGQEPAAPTPAVAEHAVADDEVPAEPEVAQGEEDVAEPAVEGSGVPRRGSWSLGGRGEGGRPAWWRRLSPGQVGAAAGVTALVVLGIAVFSAAGQARLLAQGFDPLIAFAVVVGLLIGGVALIRATREPGRRDHATGVSGSPAAEGVQQPPPAGEDHHQADQDG